MYFGWKHTLKTQLEQTRTLIFIMFSYSCHSWSRVLSLSIFHTELKPRERGTQFPLISASLEGFANALTSQRRQRQQMTDLKDWCSNVSATEPPSYFPALLMWPWRAHLPNFLTSD